LVLDTVNEMSLVDAALAWVTKEMELFKEQHPDFLDPDRDAAVASLKEKWAKEDRRITDALNGAGVAKGDKVVFAPVD
jgi:hypothetical protein